MEVNCIFFKKYTELTQWLEYLRLAGIKGGDSRVVTTTLALNRLFADARDVDLLQFSQSPEAFRGIYPKTDEETRAKKIFLLIDKMRSFHKENLQAVIG